MFVSDLGKIMKYYGEAEDHIEDNIIDGMIDECRGKYFGEVILTPCKNTDI